MPRIVVLSRLCFAFAVFFLLAAPQAVRDAAAAEAGQGRFAATVVGRKNVVVDGVTDCANYPASAPQGLAQFCVPDADNVAGQCSISLKLGLARAGCNRLQGAASDDWGVDRYSYVASAARPERHDRHRRSFP